MELVKPGTWSSWSIGRLIYEVIKDRRTFINWLFSRRLIPEKRYCAEGHVLKKLMWKHSYPVYRCFRRHVGTKKIKQISVMKGTIFSLSKLKGEQILMISLLFANHYSYCKAMREMHLFGKELASGTMLDWYSLFRDLISRWMFENQTADGKLGGDDKTVNIEVYELERAKDFGGDGSTKADWIMGMVELETSRYQIKYFHGKPNGETVIELITTHILPQTKIDSDSEVVLRSLENCEDYYVSKHEEEKIPPEYRTLLQAEDSLWRSKKLWKTPGTIKTLKGSAKGERYLEYLFRRKMVFEKIECFDQLIEIFRLYYPPEV